MRTPLDVEQVDSLCAESVSKVHPADALTRSPERLVEMVVQALPELEAASRTELLQLP